MLVTKREVTGLLSVRYRHFMQKRGPFRRIGAVLLVGGLALAIPVAPAAAAVPAGLNYVALGDSYSAGFGVLPLVPDTEIYPGCFQAAHNYPHQVAAALGLTLIDRTCSGAVTANVRTTSSPVGQVPMPPLGPPPVDPIPTLPPQAASLNADTDIVTISIGGNDLDFATVSSLCMRPDSVSEAPFGFPFLAQCKLAYQPDPNFPNVDSLLGILNNTVAPALDLTFANIRALAPNAKVFVVGYPAIAPDAAHAPTGCYLNPTTDFPNPPFVNQNTVPYSAVDTHYLQHIENELDKVIQAKAGDHDFTYIDTWEGSADHTLCATEPYILGIGFTNDNTLGTAANTTLLPGLYVTLGALHPNAAGVGYLTREVIAAISSHPDFAEAAQGPTLPATGPQPATLAGLSVALLGFGLLLIAAIRRRGSQPAERR